MFSSKVDIAAFLWRDSRPMRDRRFIRFLPFLCLFVLMLTRPVTDAAAPAGGAEAVTDSRVNLPQGMGWEDWQVVRDQHAHRAMVKVFVRRGETPATAKVRVMVAQTPKPTFDSPHAIVDALVQTANHQCQKASANSLRKSADDLIYELRAFGCAGQKGERYILHLCADEPGRQLAACRKAASPQTPFLSDDHAGRKLIAFIRDFFRWRSSRIFSARAHPGFFR